MDREMRDRAALDPSSGPAGPFNGLRVVELGQFIAVPYSAQLLADGGADVIKVEPLTGDPSRWNGGVGGQEGKQYLNKNRGKRSLAADLRAPDVLAAVTRLTAAADVVLINMRAESARRMRLDYDSIAAVNPRVIYGQNTAFGERGPLATTAGVDVVLQAHAGMAQVGNEGPIMLDQPFIDYTAALLLAFGVSTALYHRERSGKGQRLDTALLQAAMVLQNNALVELDGEDQSRRREQATALQRAFTEGRSWSQAAKESREATRALLLRSYYGFFNCKGGALALGGSARHLQQKIATALGVQDLRLSDAGHHPDDPVAYADCVDRDIAAALLLNTADHWVGVIGREGVPIAPVTLREQALDDSQAWDNEFYTTLDQERGGRVTVVAPPLRLDRSPFRAGRSAPALGEHTYEVLREAGLRPAQIDDMIARGVVR